MRSALERSGYLLEQRVQHVLEEYGYYVETNPAYPDPTTGKSREFDLQGYTTYDLRRGDELLVSPMVSCINSPIPLAFFTYKHFDPTFNIDHLKIGGIPVKITADATGRSFQTLQRFLRLERYHHYCHETVATQYCSFTRKSKSDTGGWMAHHADEHYDSIRAFDSILETHLGTQYNGWSFDAPTPAWIALWFYYPMLVVQGELYEVRLTDSDFDITPTEHVLFKRMHYGGAGRRDFFVDVVTENYLPNFLEMIQDETNRIRRACIHHKRKLEVSIEALKVLALSFGDIPRAMDPDTLYYASESPSAPEPE